MTALVAAGVLASAGWLGIGCGPAVGAKAGTQCFSTIDCAAGLACVPKGSIRVCSSNVSALETMEDAGVDAQPAGDSSIPVGIYPVDSGNTGVEDAPQQHSAS